MPRYSPISNVPGYSYTRSGAKMELGADGVPISFAANVPGIAPGIGYWSRQSLTNNILQSQTFENASWAGGGMTVLANDAVAPDGTPTGDKFTEDAAASIKFRWQSVASTAGASHTYSVFAKAGTATVLQLYADTKFCNFNLSTGAFTATNCTGYMTALANGWYRCTIVLTVAGATADPHLALVDNNQAAAATPNYTGSSRYLYVWQAQILAGNLPDGGPIIVTTTAAATVGEDLLSADDTVGADADQLFMATGSARYTGNGRLAMWSNEASANNVVDVFFDGSWLHGYIIVAGAVVSDQTLAYTAGDTVTAIVRRLAGQWRFGIVKNGILTWAASATAGFPSGLNKVRVANYLGAAGWPAAGAIKFVGRKLGTFDTDAKVLAAAAEVA